MITSFLMYDKENNIEGFEWTPEDGEFPQDKFNQCIEIYEQMINDGYEIQGFTSLLDKTSVETRVGELEDSKFAGFRVQTLESENNS